MLAAAYFLSGVAGLTYEVTWTRLVALRLGHSTAAASMVLAAFMGGLALGALAGSRLVARRSPRTARLAYAALETAVIVLAIALPFLLDALTPLLRWTYADGDGGALFATARLSTTILALMVPALALGATFPCVIKAIEARPISSGGVYAINTFGAALGAIAAGFFLLPSFGVTGSAVAAMSASAASVVLALVAGDAGGPEEPKAPLAQAQPRQTARRPPAEPRAVSRGVLWCVVALTGAATIFLEVAWTRLLALLVGPSTYAFAGVLAICIAALAVGSALGAGIGSSRRDPAPWLSIVLAAVAAMAASSVLLAGSYLPRTIAETMVAESRSFLAQVAVGVRAVALVVGPVMCALGAAFPLVMQMAERSGGERTTASASLYAVNTAAGVIGALAAGFVLLPMWGVEWTLRAAAIALTGAAGVAIAFCRLSRGWRAATSVMTLTAVAATLTASPWDERLLASGVYKYGRSGSGDLDAMLTAGALHYYRDGAAATVSVTERAGVRSMSIDGKVDASTGGDMLTQKLLAHLPLLLHDDPKAVAIIGLGSGVTAGAALTHPVAAVDVVELSPEVVAASHLFDVENGAALNDPRTRLIVGDGRSHLLLTSTSYDVIVSEPSNPWMAGVASLFTQEFFIAARARLSPGGILCQWAHVYDISAADLRSIVATFRSVFPMGTLWLVGEGDLLLIGSQDRVGDRLANLSRHLDRPGVAEDLARVGVRDAFALLTSYVGDGEQMETYAAGAPLQRDRLTALEFTGPPAVNSPDNDNAPELLALRAAGRRGTVAQAAIDGAAPAQWRELGRMLERAGAFALAYDSYARALDGNVDDVHAAFGIVSAAGPARRVNQAGELLSRLIAAHPQAGPLRAGLSKWRASTGDIRGAVDAARVACALPSTTPESCGQLASIYTDAGDGQALGVVAAVMSERFPDHPETHYANAALAFMHGDLAAARHIGEKATESGERRAAAWNLLGAVAATRGDGPAARRAFLEAIHLDPRDSAAYENLATFELTSGDAGAAARWFAEALAVDPASQRARQGFLDARRR